LAGRALLVRRTKTDVEPPRDALLALANIRDGDAELFPERAEPGGEVLVDLGPFEDATSGRLELPSHRRRSMKDRWWSATATLRQLIDVRLRLVVLAMISVLIGGT